MTTSNKRFFTASVSLIVAWLQAAPTRRKVMTFAQLTRLNVCAFAVLGATAHVARADSVNDYPTAAPSDYVFASMKANGETRPTLDQCSCLVHLIAALL